MAENINTSYLIQSSKILNIASGEGGHSLLSNILLTDFSSIKVADLSVRITHFHITVDRACNQADSIGSLFNRVLMQLIFSQKTLISYVFNFLFFYIPKILPLRLFGKVTNGPIFPLRLAIFQKFIILHGFKKV